MSNFVYFEWDVFVVQCLMYFFCERRGGELIESDYELDFCNLVSVFEIIFGIEYFFEFLVSGVCDVNVVFIFLCFFFVGG